jgi:hypothetical protein
VGGPITSVSFNVPYCIIGDVGRNYLFISDQYYVWKYVINTNNVAVFAQSTTLGAGYSGDGGDATSAQLKTPTGLWLTTSGDLYVCDTDNNRIRKIAFSGIISTVTGIGASGDPGGFGGDGSPAASATLNHPKGVYVDTKGQIFIADYGNSRIRLIETNNIISTFAGTGATAYNNDNLPRLSANINTPYDVKGDSLGNIYIGDTNCVLRVVDNNGILFNLFGSASCGFPGQGGIFSRYSRMNGVRGIWVDSSSTVYFSDYNSIQKGVMMLSAPSYQPSVSPNFFMQLVAGSFNSGLTGDGGQATSALIHCRMLYVDTSGNVYIPDNSIYQIRKVTPAGIITNFGGASTTTSSTAGVSGPIGSVYFGYPFSIIGRCGWNGPIHL